MIHADVLRSTFDFYGHYFKVKGDSDKYRNLLVIKRKESAQDQYEALIVLLNPGGGKPLDKKYFEYDSFKNLPVDVISLV